MPASSSAEAGALGNIKTATCAGVAAGVIDALYRVIDTAGAWSAPVMFASPFGAGDGWGVAVTAGSVVGAGGGWGGELPAPPGG